jgi:hypothetical protein
MLFIFSVKKFRGTAVEFFCEILSLSSSDQGDQIGKIFGWLFTLGIFLMTEIAQIYGLLIPNVSAMH